MSKLGCLAIVGVGGAAAAALLIGSYKATFNGESNPDGLTDEIYTEGLDYVTETTPKLLDTTEEKIKEINWKDVTNRIGEIGGTVVDAGIEAVYGEPSSDQADPEEAQQSPSGTTKNPFITEDSPFLRSP